jgi:glycosyltransferase involved in cell wall biosynthesis
MIRNRLYYSFKPFIPRSLRLGIRSWVTTRKRERVNGTWPILPGSETPPEGWPGWPDNKRFAFVLSHDVEGQGGVDKTRSLMELEAKLGYRSSFNFIPEGDYRVPKALRDELTSNGFEVGVHDLHHDGKLYSSRAGFVQRARRINEYLKDWGAVGFRSGFMLHNLEWLGDLNALYDASTFDTDPFEPQPEGAGTIFPFWVPRVAGSQPSAGNSQRTLNPQLSTLNSGYIELPYTLAQDSTMFLLLRERHPDIWFQKLDWVARHGGMVLVNVHPDYVRFGNEPASQLTFPSECYARLLEYARQRYGDSFWQPLPRELAAYAAQFKPAPPRRPKRVCMVSYSDYHSDTRVMRYAEALARRGDHVDMLALRPNAKTPQTETLGNVHLFNLQDRFAKNERLRASFLSRVLRFLATTSFWIARQHRRKHYDLLHIHNVPDFLVVAGLLPRLTGAKVILDVHDILPEFYENKFGKSKKSLAVRVLKLLERASSRVADHVIIANHLWREKYATRTRASDKCSVFINNVETDIFRPVARTRQDGKFIVLFPGGLQWHQGLDIAIRAFKQVSPAAPHAEFHIYGDGNMKEILRCLVTSLELDGKVRFFDPLPVNRIAQVMADADLGVVPKRADSFGNEAYSTKIMEFMSVGAPVVVSNTKIDRYYFDDSVVRFFESGSHDSLAKAMLELINDPEKRRQLAENGLKYAAQHKWELRKADYLHLVDALLAGRPVSPDLDQTRRESQPRPVPAELAVAT